MIQLTEEQFKELIEAAHRAGQHNQGHCDPSVYEAMVYYEIHVKPMFKSIDIKKLEDNLDEALEKETPESLTEFLKGRVEVISYWDSTGKHQTDFDRLYKELVPSQGESTTIEGELIRGINRLYYEYCNNGNCNARDVNTTNCRSCNGDGYVSVPCCSCSGEGCGSCEGTGMEDETCPVCGGTGVEDEEFFVDGFYLNFLNLIEEKVGCLKEVEKVKSHICSCNNYYTQGEKNIYNDLCDKVIEYVLKREKEGFTKI